MKAAQSVVAVRDMLAEVDRSARTIAGRIFDQAEQPAMVLATTPVKRGSGDFGDAFHGPPVPLRSPLPTPDLSHLPAELRDHVISVAGHLQVPIELPLSFGLGALSIAAAKRIRIQSNFVEPAILWTCAVLPPGVRKTAAERQMMAPVREFECRLRDDTADVRRARNARRGVLQKRMKQLEDRAAKLDDPNERNSHFQEMAATQRELDDTQLGHPPRLLTDDCTPERLVGLMAENGGRIAIASAEPGVFAMMAGKYRDGEQSEVYRKAWSGGEPITDDRQGRDGQHVADPALTLAIAAQPAAFVAMRCKRELRGLGTLARFLFWMPDAGVGYRRTGPDVPGMNEAAAASYADMIRSVLALEGEHLLKLSPAAGSAFFAFHAQCERDMRPGGPLSDLADWGGKLHGQALRLAGVLHLAKHRGVGPLRIDPETMACAISIASAARSHAAAVFGLLERPDDGTAVAEYVAGRLSSEPITVRDLWQRCRGKKAIGSTDDLRAILGRLEQHDYVRMVTPDRNGPGRPSDVVIPNLILGNGYPKSPETPTRAGSGDYGDGTGGDPYERAEREGMAHG